LLLMRINVDVLRFGFRENWARELGSGERVERAHLWHWRRTS